MGGILPADVDISIEGHKLALLSPEIEAKKNINQLKRLVLKDFGIEVGKK